ncbi:uncharacterized protein LOC117488211 [Trematomus bernacchii]|uniref:uncharacterized protein LOC117488211 n=1 Tax=Trematomus bernacchii TaxID=40690 RepID=UPI00146AF9D1|nr:uncharacterized protein LOC117488211 [Trematomus bernacchii]
MEAEWNRRGSYFNFVRKEHLKLDDLRKRKGSGNNYLFKNEIIPEYPRPEIHVSHLKHDTDRDGLEGITKSGGFKGKQGLVWWGLVVGGEELRSAEQRLLQETYPDRTEQQVQDQQSFLGEFASSPAFKKSSRLGSYRFTFSVQELLEAYSRQFCGGEQPLMRVYETHLYKQEVMYAVLVHSPANQEQFSEYPLLSDDPNAVCCYRDGRFIWRPEAMCETHRFVLSRNDETQQMEAVNRKDLGYRPYEFYVWDNVGIALHVEEDKVITSSLSSCPQLSVRLFSTFHIIIYFQDNFVGLIRVDLLLEFGPVRLREKLKFCEGEKLPHAPDEFDDFPLAEVTVRSLWPEDPSPLERDEEQDINEAE